MLSTGADWSEWDDLRRYARERLVNPSEVVTLTRCSYGLESPRIRPPSHGVDADAEQIGGLTHLDRGHPPDLAARAAFFSTTPCDYAVYIFHTALLPSGCIGRLILNTGRAQPDQRWARSRHSNRLTARHHGRRGGGDRDTAA
jgi:hypothetical protein